MVLPTKLIFCYAFHRSVPVFKDDIESSGGGVLTYRDINSKMLAEDEVSLLMHQAENGYRDPLVSFWLQPNGNVLLVETLVEEINLRLVCSFYKHIFGMADPRAFAQLDLNFRRYETLFLDTEQNERRECCPYPFPVLEQLRNMAACVDKEHVEKDFQTSLSAAGHCGRDPVFTQAIKTTLLRFGGRCDISTPAFLSSVYRDSLKKLHNQTKSFKLFFNIDIDNNNNNTSTEDDLKGGVPLVETPVAPKPPCPPSWRTHRILSSEELESLLKKLYVENLVNMYGGDEEGTLFLRAVGPALGCPNLHEVPAPDVSYDHFSHTHHLEALKQLLEDRLKPTGIFRRLLEAGVLFLCGNL